MVKKFLFTLLTCLLLTSSLLAQKIAIIDFTPLGSVTPADIRDITALSSRFRSQVVQTKKFEVMERKELATLKEELRKQESDDFNKETASDEDKRFLDWLNSENETEFDEKAIAKAGRMIGAEYIVHGEIGLVKSTYIIDVRLVHCESTRIADSYSETYKGDIDGLIVLMEKVAKRMAGVEDKSNLWMYLTGGGVVTAATIIYLILQPEEVGLPEPPTPPSN